MEKNEISDEDREGEDEERCEKTLQNFGWFWDLMEGREERKKE